METDKLDHILSGFSSLDNIVGGFRPGELIVVGARPSIGKSVFLRNIISNISEPVAYFTPVQTSFQLSLRFILEYLERGQRAGDSAMLRLRMMCLDSAPLHVDDTTDISVRDFRLRAARLVKKKGVRLIAIDYLQQMRYQAESSQSRKTETAAVVRCLKETAKELNVPVIALSSLARNKNGCYSRPQTGDLKYAPAAIEENADVICLMWRRDESAGSETIVSVVRNRNGQTGDVRFNYDPAECYSFSEIAD